jgi:hypothetical protein
MKRSNIQNTLGTPRQSRRGGRYRLWLLVLLCLSLFLGSCSLSGGISYKNPTPVTTVQLSYPQQTPRTYEIWMQNTVDYPRPYFHEAAHTLAAAFDLAIQAGYAGAVVNISLITSNSYNPANTILSFTIPKVPLYPQLVRHHSSDPYIDSQLAKEDERVYQQQVQAFQQTLERVRAQVRQFTNKLRSLNPLVDTTGETDIWGAFNRAALHLQGGKSPNYLILVSTLANSNWGEFIEKQGFWGKHTHVRVDWYFCTNAPICQQNTEFWQGAFQHGGMLESQFNDPAQSRILALTNRLLA